MFALDIKENTMSALVASVLISHWFYRGVDGKAQKPEIQPNIKKYVNQ